MIEITLRIKDENGRIKMTLLTPPQPTATEMECRTAHQMFAQIKDVVGKFLREMGSGTILEVSTVKCPHCGTVNTRKADTPIVQCSKCQKEFGA